MKNESLLTALKFYNDIEFREIEPTSDSINVASSILLALSNVPTVDILNETTSTDDEIGFNSTDIPQFSSIEDCFNAVDRLVRSGLDGVSFAKVGYFLRTTQRKKGADCKYGENHIKCAELMGLCRIDRGVWKNSYSYAYECLDNETKLSLRPKLCLGIKLIRTYFKQGQQESYLSNALSCLSESTRKRRTPNLNTLISIVKSDL